jgi:hypothetical protein
MNAPARGPAWIDPESLQADEPLALHDLQWVLQTADEGAQEVIAPNAVHPFTLGRWECALSEEQSADVFEAAHLTIARERRLVCTHASGMTVQTELSCGYEAPSPAAEGAPARAGRHTVLNLAEAPALTWSCRTTLVERLRVRQQEGATADLCVSEGRSLVPCDSGSGT